MHQKIQTRLHAQYIFIAINLLWSDLVRDEWVLASKSRKVNEQVCLYVKRREEERESEREMEANRLHQ